MKDIALGFLDAAQNEKVQHVTCSLHDVHFSHNETDISEEVRV